MILVWKTGKLIGPCKFSLDYGSNNCPCAFCFLPRRSTVHSTGPWTLRKMRLPYSVSMMMMARSSERECVRMEFTHGLAWEGRLTMAESRLAPHGPLRRAGVSRSSIKLAPSSPASLTRICLLLITLFVHGCRVPVIHLWRHLRSTYEIHIGQNIVQGCKRSVHICSRE